MHCLFYFWKKSALSVNPSLHMLYLDLFTMKEYEEKDKYMTLYLGKGKCKFRIDLETL